MVRNKRGIDLEVGDEILIQPGEVGTVEHEPMVVGDRVFVGTDRVLLTGGVNAEVRVVAEGRAE